MSSKKYIRVFRIMRYAAGDMQLSVVVNPSRIQHLPHSYFCRKYDSTFEHNYNSGYSNRWSSRRIMRRDISGHKK